MSEDQCSELFADVFSSHSGGCVRTCACGREYFNSNGGWDWDEGELENLKQKAAEQPDKYFDLDYTVTTMLIGGEAIVHGCCCDKAKRYEKFIINHAAQLAEYLDGQARMLRDLADKISLKERL